MWYMQYVTFDRCRIIILQGLYSDQRNMLWYLCMGYNRLCGQKRLNPTFGRVSDRNIAKNTEQRKKMILILPLLPLIFCWKILRQTTEGRPHTDPPHTPFSIRPRAGKSFRPQLSPNDFFLSRKIFFEKNPAHTLTHKKMCSVPTLLCMWCDESI